MNRKNGFTLVQTVIAMGLVSMLLLAIMQGTTYVFKAQRNLAATKDFENYISEIEHYLSDSDTCRKVLRLDKIPQVSQIFDPNSNATNTNIVLYDPKTSGTSSSDEILKTGLTLPKFKIKSVSYTYEPPAGGAVGGSDVVYNGSDLTTYYVKVSVIAEKQGETIGAKEVKRDFFTSFFLSKATPPVLGQIQHCGGVFSKDALAQETCTKISGAVWDVGTKKCYIDYCNNNGNTETQYGEECDSGKDLSGKVLNGIPCNPLINGNKCTYCSKTCRSVTLRAKYILRKRDYGKIGFSGGGSQACRDGVVNRMTGTTYFYFDFCKRYSSSYCNYNEGTMIVGNGWGCQNAKTRVGDTSYFGNGVYLYKVECVQISGCHGDDSWTCGTKHTSDGCSTHMVYYWDWLENEVSP